MGGFALHLQHHRIDAIGGGGNRVSVRRLVGEDVVMLAGQLGDDLLRAGRAHFLIRVEQHRDRAVLVELLRLEQLQRMQDHRHATLGIGHAGAVGALLVHAERALCGGAFGEHRVVMHHQQEVLAASAFEGADDVVAGRWRGRAGADLRPKRLQAFDQHFADRCQALGLAGAGIHRHQLFHGFDIGALFGLGLLEQLGGFDFGSDGRQ